MIIRNPVDWAFDQIRLAGVAAESVGRAVGESRPQAVPEPRRITVDDLRRALAQGVEDFSAYRSDVIFLCVIYPVVGLLLGRAIFGTGLLPLLFPLASGFALIGPAAGIGLYEMSRRRELGHSVGWPDAFGVLHSRTFGAIVALGLLLLAVFIAWLGAAQVIYDATLGPEPPVSAVAFLRDIFTTGAGWAMIIVGCGVGFLFAVLSLAVGVVSFPLLLDREVPLGTAVATSIRAVIANPRTMALWGLIVAGGLVLGSIPLFLGLIFVMPVLGHATWHLYRTLVPR